MTKEKQFSYIWDRLPFTKLFYSFKLAAGLTKLIIALSAVTAICLSGYILDLCAKTVATNPDQQPMLNSNIPLFTKFTGSTELDIYVTDHTETKSFIQKYKLKNPRRGVFSTLWHFGAARFNGATLSLFKRDLAGALQNIWLYLVALSWALRYHPFYSAVYFTIVIVIMSFAGGAICRCAALEFARGEKPGITEALRFAKAKFSAFLSAPLTIAAVITACAAVIFAIGLLGNIKFAGELILALTLGAALLITMLILWLLTGAAAGTFLMFPTIAYEGSNGFDAISRSFEYLYRKPLTMLFYIFIAAVFGTISYLVVRFFVFLLLATTHLLLDLALFNGSQSTDKLSLIWPTPNFFNLLGAPADIDLTTSQSLAASVIHLTLLIVVGLVVAFVISFYFCANTIIYALMRNKVDSVTIDRIHIELDQLQDHKKTPRQNSKEQNEQITETD